MALTATGVDFFPAPYFNVNDETPLTATPLQGHDGTNPSDTQTADVIPIGTQTSGQCFHLTKVAIYIQNVTTTASFNLLVGANTITSFPTNARVEATSTVSRGAHYTLDFGPVGILWTTDSTTAAVTLHASNTTKTATVTDIFAMGYLT